MSGSTAVDLEISGPVALIALNRPAVRNAIDPSICKGLDEALTAAEDANVRVIVVRGNEAVLSAGADLDHVRSVADDPDELERFVKGISDVLDRLEAARAATVCVVEGYAVAGGCELMLACDIAIAATDAQIGDGHLEYGLVPGAGGSVRLPRALPPARARFLLLTGELVTGRVAAEWGLVSLAVDADQLDAEVDRVVTRLASLSGSAIAAAKRMVMEGRDLPIDDAILSERAIFLKHFRDNPDPREGMSAFGERRQPSFE